jgi:hypothetical protein
MFKGGRGGFATYTKTGRNIALGRSLGESMTRGSSSSGRTSSSNEEVGICGYILYIILILLLIDQITKATNKYQAQ